jgi:hypothetical protein
MHHVHGPRGYRLRCHPLTKEPEAIALTRLLKNEEVFEFQRIECVYMISLLHAYT